MCWYIAITLISIVLIINTIIIGYLIKRISDLEIKHTVHTSRINNQTDCILMLTSISKLLEKRVINIEENK